MEPCLKVLKLLAAKTFSKSLKNYFNMKPRLKGQRKGSVVCGRLSKILRETQNSVNAQRVQRQKGVRTFRPTESSPHGRFAHVWTFRLMGVKGKDLWCVDACRKF